MLWGRTDTPFKGSSFDQYTDPYGAGKRLTDVIDQLESGEVPKDRVFSILYRDLVAEPVATAARIHEYFHLAFTDQSRAAMEEYVRRNPRTARPPHKVDPETKAAVDLIGQPSNAIRTISAYRTRYENAGAVVRSRRPGRWQCQGRGLSN